jgi:hypothetical protein
MDNAVLKVLLGIALPVLPGALAAVTYLIIRKPVSKPLIKSGWKVIVLTQAGLLVAVATSALSYAMNHGAPFAVFIGAMQGLFVFCLGLIFETGGGEPSSPD